MNIWRKSTYSVGNGACAECAANWRKSTHSMGNGDCLEADGPWAKATGSNSFSNCVQVAWRPVLPSLGWHHARVRVRDSKDLAGPVLEFTPAAWQAFTNQVKAGAA